MEPIVSLLAFGSCGHPSWCPPNRARSILTAITHNLLRAAGTLAGTALAVARGATLRRHLINIPARITRPQGRWTLHLPAHWPRADAWNQLWDNTFAHHSRKVAV